MTYILAIVRIMLAVSDEMGKWYILWIFVSFIISMFTALYLASS